MPRPIIDGSRNIPAGSWTPHATLANVYYADVVHEVATVVQAIVLHANTFHIAMWAGETLLAAVFGDEATTTIADNVATIAAAPGSFTAHLQGSSDSDPRSGSGGTNYRYYVHLSDGGDPRSNGVPVNYAEQVAVGILTDGTWRGLEFRRNANKDMCGRGGASNIPVTIEDCVFRDAAVHGFVGGPVNFSDCSVTGRSTSRLFGGGGFHFFRDDATLGTGAPSSAVRCQAEGVGIGFYSHGTSGPGETTRVTLTDDAATDCNAAVACGHATEGWLIEGLVSTGCRVGVETGIGSPGEQIKASVARRSSYTSPTTGTCIAFLLSSHLVVEDTDLVFQTADVGRIYRNGRAQFLSDAAMFFTLTLRRVTKTGTAFAPQESSFYAQVDLVLEDCSLGELCQFPGSYPFRSLTATGSTFGLAGRSLAQIQADHPGVDGTNTII